MEEKIVHPIVIAEPASKGSKSGERTKSRQTDSISCERVEGMSGEDDESDCEICVQQTETEAETNGGKMTKLEDAEQRLNAAKKKQIELKTQLAKSETTLNATKADYAERVRSGAEDAELDKMDAEIFNLDRARARIEIRLDQCNRDIEELLTAREVAHREEEDEKNRADEAAAIEEAAVLEKAILAFVAAAEVHWQRVQGIREHYKARGVAQIPFKLSNLERRITAIFRNGSINRAFEQSYVDIFKGNIAAAEFQLNRTAPTGELASGDAGAIEQAEAVN